MTARRLSASNPPSPSSSTITSNVHSSPRWLQNTPSTSNGVALKRSATPRTSAGATNRNTAAGSTKRRISQGQAMRSIFGRERVTQTVRPAASPAGVPQPRRRALAQLQPVLADDDRGPAAVGRRPVGHGQGGPAAGAGDQPGI